IRSLAAGRDTRPAGARSLASTLRSLTLATGAAFFALATPAGAQQLIDAGRGHVDGSGGSAFVVFTIMVFGIGFGLFFMDRVRRRATERDGGPTS
ncbi:MAG: hypothetical protein WEA75_06115, partial [Acidimicrobiia bacterium]